MTPTRNRLAANVRATSIDILQAALTSSIDLALQTKQCHWNVKGHSFIAIHQMLDELYDQMTEASDTLAERLVALGGFAEGTAKSVTSMTSLSTYLGRQIDQGEVIGALANGYAEFSDCLVAQIDETADIGDPTSSDVLTEVSRMTDKALWFLEAHLPTENAETSVA